MRPDTNVVTHTGTIDDEGYVPMRIDPRSLAHIQSVLIGLYSDPVLACIREYSTNAWDAHREAGHTDPIEVTLPNALDPVFTVRDHGTGMSVFTIENQFNSYGWSSKRDSDAVVGMLGLGCKSALAYTSQFTMVSIHEGVRATVLITRLGDGGAALKVVDTVCTDEPNGVTIQIPTSDYNAFRNKAKEFFKYWDTGHVLIDGEPNVSIFDEAYSDRKVVHLDPDVVVLPGVNDESRLVMGNVAYPMPTPSHFRTGAGYASVVARVDIGTVFFAPNRESLLDEERTREVYADINAYIKWRTEEALNDAITHAPDPQTAFELTAEAKQLVGWRTEFKWQGLKVPTKQTRVTDKNGFSVRRIPGAYRRDMADNRHSVTWEMMHGAGLIVTEYPDTMNTVHGIYKAKARHLCEQLGVQQGDIYFVRFRSRDLLPWAKGKLSITFEKLKLIKVPHLDVLKAPRQKSDRWRVMDADGNINPVELYDLPNVVGWLPAASNLDGTYTGRQLLEPDQHILIVRKPDIDAGRIPSGLPEFEHWIKQEFDRRWASLTPSEAWCLHRMNYGDSEQFDAMSLYGSRIDNLSDSELVAVLKLLNAGAGGNADWLQRAQHMIADPNRRLRREALRMIAQPFSERIRALKKKYPVLDPASAKRWDTLVGTLNMVHLFTEGVHLNPFTY